MENIILLVFGGLIILLLGVMTFNFNYKQYRIKISWNIKSEILEYELQYRVLWYWSYQTSSWGHTGDKTVRQNIIDNIKKDMIDNEIIDIIYLP